MTDNAITDARLTDHRSPVHVHVYVHAWLHDAHTRACQPTNCLLAARIKSVVSSEWLLDDSRGGCLSSVTSVPVGWQSVAPGG